MLHNINGKFNSSFPSKTEHAYFVIFLSIAEYITLIFFGIIIVNTLTVHIYFCTYFYPLLVYHQSHKIWTNMNIKRKYNLSWVFKFFIPTINILDVWFPLNIFSQTYLYLYTKSRIFIKYYKFGFLENIFSQTIIFINKSRIFIILLQVWFLNFFLQTLLYLLTKVTCLFIYIYSSLVFNFFYPNNIMIIYFVCKQYYTLLSIIRLPFFSTFAANRFIYIYKYLPFLSTFYSKLSIFITIICLPFFSTFPANSCTFIMHMYIGHLFTDFWHKDSLHY